MSTSFIPRETIIKHVQTHYPNKKLSEVNDIVISAIALTGKKQADVLDFKKHNKVTAQAKRQKFENAKDNLKAGLSGI